MKVLRQSSSKANAEHSTFAPPGGAPALNDATATFLAQMNCKEVEGGAHTKYYEIVFKKYFYWLYYIALDILHNHSLENNR